ncbi:hypothetical protein CDV36_004908 [Fusarium kuroshium]|uniref:C2H2-type domain-containing protein n=1 Tax=Fusarium kuroshium TaxID=2010991 RepID=A0A3M2SCV0_9HYPO|nr:hypothetical protein CDV36_004908 [Fusarium kuroshium]
MPSGQSRRHGTGSAPAPVVPTPNLCRPCAILLDGCNGPILGGKALGVQSHSEIDSHLFMYNLTHAESSLGFSIEFPYGQANEEEGFSICHRFDYTKNTTSQSDMHKIEAFKRHKDALCHLTKETFKLDLYDNWEDRTKSGEWDAKVVNHPQGIDALNAHHPIAEHEMVLLVRRPLPTQAAVRGSEFEVITFHDRLAANVALNEGVNQMSLHRDLVRGTGFYDTMLAAGFEGPSLKPLRNTARSLPVVNLLGTDEARVNALVEEGAHPDDRVRFQTYLSERPLGLGVITADAWTLGESNALAVGSIGMACSLGKIYTTGPTDAVVDSFAARLDRVGTSVTDRMNEGKKNDETRVRYRHVVRGYKIDDEVSAFLHLLRFPDDDRAAPSWFLSGQSEWKTPLSAAYWLLILLRSPKVCPLRLDDSDALHEMRSRIEKDRDEQLYRLGALAAQGIDWIEYEQGTMLSKDRLVSLLEDVVRIADIVCTTPSLSAKEPYSAWKHKAQGIMVDEAACMSRPDLYCVWDNTLLPCLMAGDDKEFPPKALDRHNRFGQHARISPLLWFKAMGWPVYRLSCQGEDTLITVYQKGALITHKRTHTGEKPFKCDYPGCSYASNQKGTLNGHKKTHRKD